MIDGFGLGYDAAYRLRTRTWAAFGQADLALANALTLVAGFRLTQEDQLFDIEVLCLDDPAIGPGGCAAFGVAPGSVADDGASRFTQGNTLISGKASLEYRPTAGELYWLSYNRGVKGGGFSVPLDGLQVASRRATTSARSSTEGDAKVCSGSCRRAFEAMSKAWRPWKKAPVGKVLHGTHGFSGFLAASASASSFLLYAGQSPHKVAQRASNSSFEQL